MCVPTLPAKSQRGAEQQSLQQVKRGKEQPMFCPCFEICGQWKLPGCSQHHLQPPTPIPVCCKAGLWGSQVRETPKCWQYHQILHVISWALLESVVTQRLPWFSAPSSDISIFFSCLSKCCSSLPQVCGWERNWTKHKAKKRGKMCLLWHWTIPSPSDFCLFPSWDAEAWPSLIRAVQ